MIDDAQRADDRCMQVSASETLTPQFMLLAALHVPERATHDREVCQKMPDSRSNSPNQRAVNQTSELLILAF